MKLLCIYSVSLLLLIPSGVLNAAQGPVEESEIDGIMGLNPVTANSCVAIWVPVPEGQALSGLSWFNNDGSSVFPEVLVESGTPEYPVSMDDCFAVSTDQAGRSSDWSDVVFTEPIACTSTGMYVLFRLTAGDEHDGEGFGGGAGFGFVESGGLEGWLSVDGENWVRVAREYGFAVRPSFVTAEPGMLRKSAERLDDELLAEEIPVTYKTELLNVAPNPFNPKTNIRFTLRESRRVKITVFDLRGRSIKTLANEVYSAGYSSIEWDGRDRSGRRVSSGTYFVQFVAGVDVFSRRMLLVK
jgi:hypothetical protein